ncbi:NAD-dependent epimerase/dehydratase family protein [Marinitenerispora sediminis]|uniref:NAD-dependent epimerase/dehydratase family protein n=1 Tax=Marinitenerispora sediminis TaxID=1931232 RepID=UPI0018F24573|nr:NAD-dependent epimerase/dehydratase family protein [Marinitenerispora sediminis]
MGSTGRVVLVTGVSRQLGARVLTALEADPGVERVIGVDSVAPRFALGGAAFVRADPRDAGVAAVIEESGADTVLHMGLAASPPRAGGRRAARENHVLGAMQVLAGCQRSGTVRRLVVRSTAAIYGVPSGDPEPCTEEASAPDAPRFPRAGFARDAAEVERHVGGLMRRRPDLSVAVLRFANVIGPSVQTPLTSYFGLKIVPTVMGYDPTMQFIHEDDGVEVVRRMAMSGAARGVFNVAAPGAMPLSQCLRRAGRPEMPVPARGLSLVGGLTRRTGMHYSPDQLRSLCYGRVLDASKLRRELDWAPAYTSQEAFDAFVAESTYTTAASARIFGRVTHRVRAAVGR